MSFMVTPLMKETMCPVERVDHYESQIAETLVSAIDRVRKVITTHQDVIWKTEAEDLLQGRAHDWKLNFPSENARGRVYYEEQSMLQLGDDPPAYCNYEQPGTVADTFGCVLSQYKVTVDSYRDGICQTNNQKRFFRVMHRGSLPDQLAMRKFLPRDLKYAKVPLCPCGSTRGEEICTAHKRFVRWPVFGISLADRARLSDDLKANSVRPKCEPVSRIAKLRALGVPMLSHEYIHPSVDPEENSYAALRGLTIDEMEALLKRDVRGHTCKMVLGISESNFIKGCAIDFLNAFLLSITPNIQRVKTHPRFLCYGTGPGPKHVVPLFQDLAETIVKSGLVDSTDNALTIVVPAFASNGLLPTTPELPFCCM
ncbi:hypothetical protein MMC18_006670 [Xylographa bjoerkii]|nr:hypothetical protein [Xylographa bjoerkii]